MTFCTLNFCQPFFPHSTFWKEIMLYAKPHWRISSAFHILLVTGLEIACSIFVWMKLCRDKHLQMISYSWVIYLKRIFLRFTHLCNTEISSVLPNLFAPYTGCAVPVHEPDLAHSAGPARASFKSTGWAQTSSLHVGLAQLRPNAAAHRHGQGPSLLHRSSPTRADPAVWRLQIWQWGSSGRIWPADQGLSTSELAQGF